MTYINILAGFETEINKINDSLTKPATDDSLFWLNQAVGKFIKLRFNGDFVHKTGFEETEKRRADLIKLYVSATFEDLNAEMHSSYDEYEIDYPSNFLFALNEDVVIKSGDKEMDTCVFECTQDSFMYRVNNSLTDFHYRFNRARPIRIRTADGCKLLTDGNYSIEKYTLGYIRKPTEITLDNPFNEYEDFEDVIMSEIIKMAAQMYLENQGDPRYKTITEEVSTQE